MTTYTLKNIDSIVDLCLYIPTFKYSDLILNSFKEKIYEAKGTK